MKKGYGVFGKSYEMMNKNDLHDINSIDHRFMQEMILLDESSYDYLYNKEVNYYDMTHHELFEFSKKFNGNSDKETINNVLMFTRTIVKNFNVEFEEMLFGGSEKQIIERGTDWCADISRVAAVILDCLSIPCRILHLANINKAYNGHVLVEAFYENKWGVIDPLYGYLFYKDKPIDAYQLLKDKLYLNGYNDYYKELFNAIAINEYNPMDKTNNYNISKPNEYYLKLINSSHNDDWIMYENVIELLYLKYNYSFDSFNIIYKGMSSDIKIKLTDNNSNEYLLRISDIKHLTRKENEYNILKLVYDNHFIVQEPILFEVIDTKIIQLTKWLQGKDLKSLLPSLNQLQKKEFAIKTADLLTKLHLIKTNNKLLAWKERFKEKIEVRYNELTQLFGYSKEYEDMYNYLINNLEILNGCIQCFNHGDFNLENIIVLNNNELGLIDFNYYNKCYGDPIFEATTIILDESLDKTFVEEFKKQFFKENGYVELIKYYKIYDIIAKKCEEL